MENQHKLIKGYRDLSQDEIDFMNEFKEMENTLAQMVQGALRNQKQNGIDPRWMAVAKTHFQQGFMAAVRAIAKPQSFWD